MKRSLLKSPVRTRPSSTPSAFEHHANDVFDTQFCIHQTKRAFYDYEVSRNSSCYCPVSQSDTCNLKIDNEHSEASRSHRLTALSAVVNSCSHLELVHLCQVIEPLLKRDFIRQLPLELSLRILSYLSTTDLLNCAKVSRHWNAVTSDRLLWFRQCLRKSVLEDFILSFSQGTGLTPKDIPSVLFATSLDKLSAAAYSFEAGTASRLYDVIPEAPQIDWKTVYRKSLQTRCNWRHGCPRPAVVLPAHHNHVITCMEVCNDWVITGSDDSSICIWNATRGELVISLFGHLGGVWSLALLPSNLIPGGAPLLVSGSCDRTARVWLLDGVRWPCLTTLFGHQSTVRCVAAQRQQGLKNNQLLAAYPIGTDYSERKVAPDQPLNAAETPLSSTSDAHLVVTGSRDTTLRLWDALSGRCIHTFRGHRGAIRCVQFTGTNIVSGSYDCTVRLWCILTGNCVRVLNGHKNRVYTLLYDGCHIISASLDTTIRVWDSHTGALKQLFCGHRSLTSEMAYGQSQGILVSSNADETIRVWNLDTGECIHTLSGPHKHHSAVTCVQLTRHFIISSSDDGTVKLWDRFTGAYLRDLLRLDGAGRGAVVWRILSSETRLICAAGSRNGLETTKLIILQFDEPDATAIYSHVCRTQLQPVPSPSTTASTVNHLFQTNHSVDSISTH